MYNFKTYKEKQIKNILPKCVAVIKEEMDADEYGNIYMPNDGVKMPLSTLKEIFNADNPKEMYYDLLDEWAFDTESYDKYEEFHMILRRELSDEEYHLYSTYKDEIWNYLNEYFCYCYKPKDFNTGLKVNIMLDSGNWNYDCACDNVLNYHGDGSFMPNSSILWLAKTQGKAKELRQACKQHFESGFKTNDNFIDSCIEELENLSSSLGTVTFLAEIDLLTVLDILEVQKRISQGHDPNHKSDSEEQPYLLIDKSVMCGLFDPWYGSGSCLEILLDKDIKLPLHNIKIAVDGCEQYGYDVDEVYGLVHSCWKPKTIVFVNKN